jgi:hypothetical protein
VLEDIVTTPTTDPVRPPQGGTRLLLNPGEKTPFSAVRETDCRTALTRGLKEYIEQLHGVAPGGREVVFKQVLQTWAEPEVPARFPSACIYGSVDGTYDASRFTPGVNKNQRIPEPDGRFLMQLAEYVSDLSVEVWCTDPMERMDFAMFMEDAFNPTDFMFGFRLVLPHYFNARASFEMKSLSYADTEEEAKRRYRRAVFTLEGRVPLIKLVGFPLAQPETRLTVVDSGGNPDP